MAMRRPGPIAAVERVVVAPVERVWAFLADPESYAGWVSGTSRIRRADRNWPEVGAQLHHCWGVGPLRVRDRTTVVAAEPPHRLVLLARARPVGVVRAEIEATAQPAGTRIVLTEQLLSGWATRWPRVSGLVQQLRNRRSVRRLAALAVAVDRTPG